MNANTLVEMAQRVDEAAKSATAIAQLTDQTAMSLSEAYVIQRQSIARRVARGERTIGIKLGFTSRAKMLQMGVDSLIWGWLTDAMLVEEGGAVDLANYIHPRVEPEVCFLTKNAIDRPLTALEAVDYLEAVAPALEIIDSRYQNFKFTLEDVVADNCSSTGLAVGSWTRDFYTIQNAGVKLRINDRVVQLGSTAAILGNPMRSVVLASRLLADSEVVLPAGSLIMAGAATAAEALSPSTFVECQIGLDNATSLGRVAFHVGSSLAQGVFK